jgi:TonB family protein
MIGTGEAHVTEKSRDFAIALALLIAVTLLLSLLSPAKMIREGAAALRTGIAALRDEHAAPRDAAQTIRGRAEAAAVPPVGQGEPMPIRSAGAWITNDDYPAEALRNNLQGRVAIRWTVDENGRARDCIIVESSGHPVLDDASCRLVVARARYVPALDKDGRAVQSTDRRGIVWRLPD